ncbi:hypothetical protein ACFLUK_02010 [Chloroflexota bacterium]
MSEQTIWELANPEGTVQLQPFVTKPHCQTLENKTVLFYWNGKHNGDVFLNKIAELLTEKVEGVKIIRGWEVTPEIARGLNQGASKEAVSKLTALKPDIVIGAQAD